MVLQLQTILLRFSMACLFQGDFESTGPLRLCHSKSMGLSVPLNAMMKFREIMSEDPLKDRCCRRLGYPANFLFPQIPRQFCQDDVNKHDRRLCDEIRLDQRSHCHMLTRSPTHPYAHTHASPHVMLMPPLNPTRSLQDHRTRLLLYWLQLNVDPLPEMGLSTAQVNELGRCFLSFH